MKKSTSKFRNGYRLRKFLGGKTYDEAVVLATSMIISNSEAYGTLMHFVDSQHPSDEYQAAYFLDTVSRLVVLDDEELERFIHRSSPSKGYVRMGKLAMSIRKILAL